jgi:hypothetical protein
VGSDIPRGASGGDDIVLYVVAVTPTFARVSHWGRLLFPRRDDDMKGDVVATRAIITGVFTVDSVISRFANVN